ncbi:MAG: hypothetical protein IPO60_11790 [Flavobacteriales bacterium]|nr:hypothetical protein [Flavobacteriales bacterium]
MGICGQGPSDFPDFAQFLVELGIDSISVTPDSLLKTERAIAEVEKTLARKDRHCGLLRVDEHVDVSLTLPHPPNHVHQTQLIERLIATTDERCLPKWDRSQGRKVNSPSPKSIWHCWKSAENAVDLGKEAIPLQK